jgi:hypothetical protein
MSLMLLLKPKDGISTQSRDVAEDESGQSYELMRNPDMWDLDGKPCLLVVKSGNATGTTIGRANGTFSIVRDYFKDMSINQTSMEWGIINYDSKSEVFSEPGDSGSVIADICGRIGGMLTGGSGKTKSSDIMPRRSGGSSSVSRPTRSPTRTSAWSPRHLDINNDIEDRFFSATSSLPSTLLYLLLGCYSVRSTLTAPLVSLPL